MTWTAMIVDDEPFARDDLRQMLSVHPEIRVVCEAGTLNEAVRSLGECRPDLIFLDIQLRGGTGFDLLAFISPGTRIIFITAYDQYAVRAFTINALDYILKPVTPERLAESVRRLSSENTRGPINPGPMTPGDKVFIRSDTRMAFVPVQAIAAITSIGGNYMVVETVSGEKLVCRKTMKEWEAVLPDAVFIRIHRSALVNVNHVERFKADKKGTGRIFVTGRTEPLSVSARMASMLKRTLSEK